MHCLQPIQQKRLILIFLKVTNQTLLRAEVLIVIILIKFAVTSKCDRLWQKQAVDLKIRFVHFSLELINNNFWLKCCKNYYSIFIGSRDLNSIVLCYSEVQ